MITRQLMWHQVNVYKITVTKSKHWMPFDLIPARNKKNAGQVFLPGRDVWTL